MTTFTPAHLLLAATLTVTAAGHAAYAQSLEPPPLRVVLEPTAMDRMSGVAWNAMTQELRRIWSGEGADVRWKDRAGDRVPPQVTLPVIFNDREVRKHDPAGRDAFGVTIFAGRELTILVSAPRARQVVSARHGLADSKDSAALDIALGLILGRVVAHEVGHALLLTTLHSAHGLMAAHLAARDAAAPGVGQFALSLAERDRLATRFSIAGEPVRQAQAAPAAARHAAPFTAAAPIEAAAAELTWTDAPPRPSRLRARR